MSGEFYVLPLCDHEISVSEFTSDWVQCRCGIYYRESTLIAFKDALQQLSAASTRIDHIETAATNLNLQRAAELGYQAAAPAFAAEAAAPTTVSAPVAAPTTASAPLTTPTVAPAQPTFTPPPVQKKPARPKRQLPKLSPQQTLLAVAGALIVIALSIFLGSTFSTLGEIGQAAVIAALVAASAFGAIKSKKYFTIISNFLAVLSALFLGAGLWAAAILKLFPVSWASPIESPYVPAVILVVGTYSFFMGKRFSIFGFSAIAAPAVASAVLVFSATYLANILASSSPARSLSGIAMLAVSIGAFATVLIGRLTLTSRLALSAEAKKLAKSSKKKVDEDDKSADEREADYQRDLLEREINALTGIYRASVVGLLAYLAVATAQILWGLLQLAAVPLLYVEFTPEPISLLSLGLFWLLGAFAIERIGAKYTASGSVRPAVKTFAWFTGFGFTAFALSVLTATLQPAATSGLIEETNIFMLILNGLIGAAFLFSVPKALADSMPRSVLASQIAAYTAWLTFGLMTPWDANFNVYTSIWLGIIAVSLLTKAWMTRTSILAWVALGAGSVSSLLPIFDSRLDASVGFYVVALSGLCIALAFGWRFAVARVLERAESKSDVVGWVHFATNLVISFASVSLWTAHRYTVNSNDAFDFWPILTLFALFALASAVLATTSKSKIVESFSVSLAGVGATFLIAGYISLTMAQGSDNQSFIWGAYSLAVFAIVLFFAKRRNAEAAAFISLLPATIAAVNFGQLIVEASESIQVITPLGFLGLAAAFALVVKKLAKPTSDFFAPAALASFAVSGAFYWFAKRAATAEWMLDTNAQLTNAVWATVVFTAMAASALVLHVRDSFSKDVFYGLYLRVVGIVTLLAGLQVSASVTQTTGSLWLASATLLVTVLLTALVAVAKKSRTWFIATLASTISLAVAAQSSAIAQFAPAQGGSIYAAWLALLIPASLAASWLGYGALQRLSSKREVDFGWVGLPVASVAAAVLAYLSVPLVSLYRLEPLPSIDYTNPWPVALGFVGLSVAYGVIRLASRAHPDGSRSLLATSLVSLAFAVIGLTQYAASAEDLTLAVATVLGAHALMYFWSSFVTRESRTALYGFILGVGASWLAIAELAVRDVFTFTQSFSFVAAVLFVLTAWLLNRSDSKLLETWSLALPITSAVGLFVGVQTTSQAFGTSANQTELLIATGVGAGYLLLANTNVLGESKRAHLSLIASAWVSWIYALWQASKFEGQQLIYVSLVLSVASLTYYYSAFRHKSAQQALLGFVVGVGASWTAIAYAVENYGFSLVQSYGFASTLLFVLTTWMLRRSDSKPNLGTWAVALPVTSALGIAFGISTVNVWLDIEGLLGWSELLIASLVGAAYLMLSRTKVLGEAGRARTSLIATAIVSWLFAVVISFADVPTRDIRVATATLVIGSSLLLFAKLEKNLASLLAATATLVTSGFFFAEVSVKAIGGYQGPELHSVLVALALVASTQVAVRIDMMLDRFKSLLVYGLPLLVVGLPATVFNWSAVVTPLAEQQSGDVTRTLTLMIVGAALLTVGLRLGNLGLTVAGAAPLALTLLPSIWFRIDEYFDGKVETEMKSLFIGGLLFGLGYGLVAALKLKINSFVYVGLPILIAMAPALANTFGALNQATLTPEDWYRFGIILGGSLVFLVLGALRRLAGFFGPGAIGVLVAAVPYAWKPLSEQTWFVWVILIIVAGLLVWMAIKLEQFKSNARSASVWLKELR